jgi:hypothetical protein
VSVAATENTLFPIPEVATGIVMLPVTKEKDRSYCFVVVVVVFFFI